MRDEKSEFGKDRRRRHHHFLVTVNYADGETFGRVYTDKEKATSFAERQRRGIVSRLESLLRLPLVLGCESFEVVERPAVGKRLAVSVGTGSVTVSPTT